MEVKEFLPRTKREWLKFILDIIVAILFIIMIYCNSYSYRQGFYQGVEYGKALCFPVNTTVNVP